MRYCASSHSHIKLNSRCSIAPACLLTASSALCCLLVLSLSARTSFLISSACGFVHDRCLERTTHDLLTGSNVRGGDVLGSGHGDDFLTVTFAKVCRRSHIRAHARTCVRTAALHFCCRAVCSRALPVTKPSRNCEDDADSSQGTSAVSAVHEVPASRDATRLRLLLLVSSGAALSPLFAIVGGVDGRARACPTTQVSPHCAN